MAVDPILAPETRVTRSPAPRAPRDRPAAHPTVRFRIDFGKRCSVGIGKIELLEAIARSGSLSQAARALRMSYRRAWLLLEDLNSSFDRRVVTTTTGGRGGGGAQLTEFGAALIAAYRDLDARLRPLADARLRAIGEHAKDGKASPVIRPTPISRTLRGAREPAPAPAPPRRRAAAR